MLSHSHPSQARCTTFSRKGKWTKFLQTCTMFSITFSDMSLHITMDFHSVLCCTLSLVSYFFNFMINILVLLPYYGRHALQTMRDGYHMCLPHANFGPKEQVLRTQPDTQVVLLSQTNIRIQFTNQIKKQNFLSTFGFHCKGSSFATFIRFN